MINQSLSLRLFLILISVGFGVAVKAQLQPKPTLQWQKCIGGTQIDAAYSIVATYDSAYVVVGYSDSDNNDIDTNYGSTDCYVAKLSASGNIVWKLTLGGSSFDQATYVQQTSDSGFILTAISMSNDVDFDTNRGMRDAWVIKLSKNGTVDWKKNYGGSMNEIPLCIKQTTDGGYVFVGWSASSDGDLSVNKGSEDCWIVKLDASGNIVWQKSMGGSSEDHFTSVIQTSDGGYLAAGSIRSGDGDITGFYGSHDVWVVKFDASGYVMWQKNYGGSSEDHFGDHGLAGAVIETFDGGYALSCFSNSTDFDVTGNHGDYDAWILKLTSNGTIDWQKSFGGSGDDEGMFITQMPDSTLIVTGLTNSLDGDVDTMYGVYDVWCFKVSAAGNLLWEQSFGGMFKESAFAMDQTRDTSVILAGVATMAGGQVTGYKGGLYDMWVVKLKMTPVINSVDDLNKTQVIISPNPASHTVELLHAPENVSWEVLNTAGQLIKKGQGTRMSIGDMPHGIYFIRLYDRNGIPFKYEKLIKI